MIAGQGVGNVLFFKGQASLDSGPTQIYLSSMLLWTLLLSIPVLGSKYNLVNLIGVALLLFAIFIAQFKRNNKKFLSTGALYIIISAICFSVFQIASAAVSQVLTPATYLLLTFAGSSLVITTVYASELRKLWVVVSASKKQVIWPSLFAAITSTLNFTFLYKAYKVAPDQGVVAILAISHVVFSVLLGVMILKETDRIRQKIIAAILATLAGALIRS